MQVAQELPLQIDDAVNLLKQMLDPVCACEARLVCYRLAWQHGQIREGYERSSLGEACASDPEIVLDFKHRTLASASASAPVEPAQIRDVDVVGEAVGRQACGDSFAGAELDALEAAAQDETLSVEGDAGLASEAAMDALWIRACSLFCKRMRLGMRIMPMLG